MQTEKGRLHSCKKKIKGKEMDCEQQKESKEKTKNT